MNRPASDRTIRYLEYGLILLILFLPLPFGGVVPAGRILLEAGAGLLTIFWILRERNRSTWKSPRVPVWAAAGLAGLLLFGLLQAIPLGSTAVSVLSPEADAMRRRTVPEGPALAMETELLEMEPGRIDPPPSLSLSPGATASAVRTGAALAGLLLIAFTVAAERGAARIAWGLGISAAFQAGYGTLILLSGADRIWHVPKKYFLDCATGTFVNRGHFAAFLAVSLPPALALALRGAGSSTVRNRLQRWFAPEGGRILLLRILILFGLSGLLLSFSRTGVTSGLLALAWVVFRSPEHGKTSRRILALLLLLAALVPLVRFDAGRLLDRYSTSLENLTAEAGRVTVWKDSARILEDYPLFGTGLGTFREVYPSYRSPQIRFFFDHAHNDLLQMAVETGLLGTALLMVLLVPFSVRAVRALAGRYGFLAVGFGAGLFAVALHAQVDFPFHIPAIASAAAVEAGALLGLSCRNRTT